MNEYSRAAQWLYETLTDPPISGISGVYEHPAPQSAIYPLITFLAQSEIDLSVIDEERIWARFLFWVRAIGQTASTLELRPVADEIESRLHRTSGFVPDAAIIASDRRGQAVATAERHAGIDYRLLGASYELIVQPLNP